MAWYDVQASGFLRDLSTALFTLAGWLWQFSYSYRDHWVLGYVVAGITDPSSDYLTDAGRAVDNFSQRYESLADFAESLLTLWGLDDLLAELWTEWRILTTDPAYWTVTKVSAYWPDFYWFVQDPEYMIHYWLGEWWTAIEGVVARGGHWVFDRLVDYWPDFYWFAQDPSYMVEFWLASRSPSLGDLFADPVHWVKMRVGDALGVPMTYWDDPWGYTLWKVKGKLDERNVYYVSWLREFGESLLRYYFEGVW